MQWMLKKYIVKLTVRCNGGNAILKGFIVVFHNGKFFDGTTPSIAEKLCVCIFRQNVLNTYFLSLVRFWGWFRSLSSND